MKKYFDAIIVNISWRLSLSFIIHVLLLSSCKEATKDESQAQSTTPNVILFYLDDSGYGDYEHNGNPSVRTPNITKLKQSGTNFTQFYVTSPACSASRYSLLTGRYPSRSGLGGWVVGPADPRYIHPREVTLAEGLKTRGYSTGIFGKWHLGSPNEDNNFAVQSLPLSHGFDEWVGTNVSHDYDNAMLIQSKTTGNTPVAGYEVIAYNLPSDSSTSKSLTERSTKSTKDFIRRNANQPFFAYVPYNMPHLGLFSGDKYKNRSDYGVLGDVLEELDESIGSILGLVDSMGLKENTIVIFSSDNGPWIRFSTDSITKYGDTRLQVGYANPFRDGKGSCWEGGHRVAGIISWPGKIQANQNQHTPISTLDILPTIFSITGVEIPEDRKIDGRDLSDFLLNDSKQADLEEFTFIYHYHDNWPSAIRKGPWKLHQRIGSQTGNNYGFSASEESPLLFQIERDLGERVELSAKDSTKTQALFQSLKSFEKEVESSGSFWDIEK